MVQKNNFTNNSKKFVFANIIIIFAYMKDKELTEEQILLRARDARIKKLSKPKELLAKNPTMMGQFVEIYCKQREAKG
jgi:hypothetical protein